MTNRNGAVTSAVPSALTRGSAHFDWQLTGATRSGTAGGENLHAIQRKTTLHPSEVNWNYKSVRAEGINAMWDTPISLGIIGAGVVWIVAGHSAPSAFGVIIGVPTIVVGLASLFGELRV